MKTHVVALTALAESVFDKPSAELTRWFVTRYSPRRQPRRCEVRGCGRRLRKRTARRTDLGHVWCCPRCGEFNNGARRRRIREMRRLGLYALIEWNKKKGESR